MRADGLTDGQSRRDEANSRFLQFLLSLLEMMHYQTACTLSLYFNAKSIITFSALLSPTMSGLSSDRPCGT